MPAQPSDFPTPGQYIRALLHERGWNQRTLAHVIGLDYGSLNKIVLDRKPLTAYTAIILGEAFGVDAQVFLDLKTKFELAVARASTVPDADRSLRASVFASLPVNEMIKRGWLDVPSFDDVGKVEASLARFFGVESVDRIPRLPHAAKKTDVGSEVTPAQLAWINRVRSIASTLQVPRYSPAAVREAIEKLEAQLPNADGVRAAAPLLAAAGVRFVVVETLSTAKIDGVCTWINDMSPVIGMTLRHDRIDNFWWVLRHEIEHVLRGHGRRNMRIDVDIDPKPKVGLPEEEKVANDAASDFCVPAELMENFYRRKHPFFMRQDLLGFAASVRRHPGLVVGQLQYRAGRFDRFREFLTKVRAVVLPEAAVDGWGVVYPVPEPAGTT